ncbi:MAG: hypothetical protein ACJ758_11290 [Actinomycetota bacterium]
MHIVQGRSLRALVASVGVIVVLATGCATSARPASPRVLQPVSAPASSEKPAETPSPKGGRRTPAPGYADPLDRYAYREAFGRCASLGVATVADAYGAPSSDPVSAATAYAEHSYPRTTHFRGAATEGCLDGFSHRA